MNNQGNGRNVLDGVICSVESCVYHTKGDRCTAETIAVRMEKEKPTKKDETLCSTFESQI